VIGDISGPPHMLSLTSIDVTRNLPAGMNPRTRRHGLIAAALLIVAIIAGLAHVCVLPVHAHAVPVDGHGSHDDDSSDNSVHTASCDALKTASATPSFILTATSVPVVDVEPVSLKGHVFDAAPVRTDPHSPPLFLLHAALLI
jgi:hypothetical protein